ncbi:MAG TPA: flagellar filament capping protein FliD [Phycisphaerae bacterium]|nr:flagellar filament capping protein FliD [Phycisphaerae bacterium]
MSGISATTGLMSGLPTADIIAQLMAIEARPLNLLQARVGELQAVRTAFADVSARLLSLKNTTLRFNEPAFFRAFQANSSDADVLTAVADKNAVPGSFGFQVHSLVSNHGLIGQGFADADATPVGAGTITLEIGNGRLNRATDLDVLNGGQGIRRGRIEITDRAGNSAEIDLTAVLDVDDVLEAINSQTAINVRARASGDRVILEDFNDTTAAGSLMVRDLATGHAAEDLGIAVSVSVAAGEVLTIEGADILNLGDSTLLSTLNDGRGVDRARTGGDFIIQRDDGLRFEISLNGNIDEHTHLNVLNNGNGVRLGVIRITTRSGDSADLDLTGATNLGDVVNAIDAAGLDIALTYFNSSSQHALQLADNSEGDGTFMIEDVSGFAARDLGIAAQAEQNTIIGNGIHRITTIGDVMRAVRYAYDAGADQYNMSRTLVDISANGNGLFLGSAGIPRGFEVIAGANSAAAVDLGILGRYDNGDPPPGAPRDLIAGLNTVLLSSLNGGAGVDRGQVRFTDRAGASVTVDLSAAQTVQDVVDLINAQTQAQLTATVNSAGNGIIIRDESGSLANPVVIADVSGTAAADLGIAGTHNLSQVNSGSLQLQYISNQTHLADLNGGRGVRTGEFRITDAAGGKHLVNVTDNQKTVGDIVYLINSAGGGRVTASINATGDGILITDTSGGTEPLQIEDLNGGFTAAGLGIAGQADDGQDFIDGSFEVRVEIDADDTLTDVARKITDAGRDFSAAVINDGSSTAPYRLSVSSLISGLRGQLLFDAGDTGLAMRTLVEARDAVVFFGAADADNPVVLRSASNTLNDVLEGVTIDLVGTSDEVVELSVTQDVDAIAGDLQGFVDAYNDVIDRTDNLTRFDAESLTRGVLFGDSTVDLVRNRLRGLTTGKFEGVSSSVSRLSAIGVTTVSGGKLSFDESKFRQVYADDPEAVEQLFTADETGFGDTIESALDDLTRSFDGLLAKKDATLQGQEDLLNDRIAALEELLDLKQARLERQFQSLELALAMLQGQQSALTVLQMQFGSGT